MKLTLTVEIECRGDFIIKAPTGFDGLGVASPERLIQAVKTGIQVAMMGFKTESRPVVKVGVAGAGVGAVVGAGPSPPGVVVAEAAPGKSLTGAPPGAD